MTGSETISGTATYDNVTVQAGGVLTVDGVLNVNQDMVLESGGVVTHSPRFEDGLHLVVNGILTIHLNGTVNTDGKGLKGGSSGTAFGEAYDENDMIVNGSSPKFPPLN